MSESKTRRLLDNPVEREAQALAEHILNTDGAVLDRAREIIRAKRNRTNPPEPHPTKPPP